MSQHFHPLIIKEIRPETKDCVSIAFHIPEELIPLYKFQQGQNLTIRWKVEGEEIRRSYSICSSPLDDELRVAVKKVLQGRFSTFANSRLKKGDTLDVLPPTGKFNTELRPENAKKYIAFAAGSGITPILSLIKTTLAIEKESHFTLVYGNRNRTSIIFREELEGIKNRYLQRFVMHHVLSREKTDSPINYGRIDALKCEALSKVINFSMMNEFFLCGPEEMIFSVKNWLVKNNIPAAKIHFELFTTPGQKTAGLQLETTRKKEEGKASLITITLDGISFEFPLHYGGEPILDAALKLGADLPFACKGGVCSTCRAKLIEGEIEMDTNYALEPDELEKGYILTCQSHPRSERVTVNFDMK
ncbi:MAG TPA: 1,2-phenylacetyl-CoA epoxidase subunit PaaE [Flavitalea sp.]|nr:1,2-phenylacetyl-CoA epoxidase subunit PaaE [Flavitalea sp.]